MSELISGKEALIALANGEDVQFISKSFELKLDKYWSNDDRVKNFTVHDFFSGTWEFRLKPRTIKISGVDVPAPFEPEDGEECFVLSNFLPQGYIGFKYPTFEGHVFQFGAWRTEEEIKQVVEALRSVFKGV